MRSDFEDTRLRMTPAGSNLPTNPAPSKLDYASPPARPKPTRLDYAAFSLACLAPIGLAILFLIHLFAPRQTLDRLLDNPATGIPIGGVILLSWFLGMVLSIYGALRSRPRFGLSAIALVISLLMIVLAVLIGQFA